MAKKKKDVPILVRPLNNFSGDDIEVRYKPNYVGSSCLHWHDFYEMEVVVGGEGDYLINGRTYPLHPGSVYLVTPADFHQIYGRGLALYNLSFNESVISEQVLRPLIQANTATVLSFSSEEIASMTQILKVLLAEYQTRAPLRQESMGRLVDYLLISYLRKLEGSHESFSRGDMTVMRVVSFIRSNFKKKLTLAMAAEEVFLTPNYVGALFYQKMGVSFNTYLMQVRLNYARALLCLGSCSVEEAAINSGFSSQTYFSDCFRRLYGYAPTELKWGSNR